MLRSSLKFVRCTSLSCLVKKLCTEQTLYYCLASCGYPVSFTYLRVFEEGSEIKENHLYNVGDFQTVINLF